MDNKELETPSGRVWLRTGPLGIILLLLGVVSLLGAYLFLGKSFSAADVLYDMGFGLLVATGVSLVIGGYLRTIEDRERRRDQEARERLEAAKREREELEREINRRLEEAGALLDKANSELQEALHEAAIHDLTSLLHEIQQDIWMIREKVDTSFEHPYKPIVDALMERLEEKIQRERGKEAPST